MAHEIEPYSTPEWEQIINSDTYEQAFILCRRYIVKLQEQVRQAEHYKTEYEKLKKSQPIYKNIINPKIIREIEDRAKAEAYKECNTDWSGMQGGL